MVQGAGKADWVEQLLGCLIPRGMFLCIARETQGSAAFMRMGAGRSDVGDEEPRFNRTGGPLMSLLSAGVQFLMWFDPGGEMQCWTARQPHFNRSGSVS